MIFDGGLAAVGLPWEPPELWTCSLSGHLTCMDPLKWAEIRPFGSLPRKCPVNWFIYPIHRTRNLKAKWDPSHVGDMYESKHMWKVCTTTYFNQYHPLTWVKISARNPVNDVKWLSSLPHTVSHFCTNRKRTRACIEGGLHFNFIRNVTINLKVEAVYSSLTTHHHCWQLTLY